MSSEPVSDKRLDELIDEYGRLSPLVVETGTFCDTLESLRHYKSLRAQQAEPPAGCAEMAREIYDITKTFIWSTASLPQLGLDSEGTKLLIAAKLAPLYDKISMLESALVETEARCTEFNATIHELINKEEK